MDFWRISEKSFLFLKEVKIMKNSTLIGLVIGFASLVFGFLLEGGHVIALLQPTAALVVFGGTVGATMISFSMHELKMIPDLIKVILKQKIIDEREIIEQIVDFADKARREGILYLQNYYEEIKDPFLFKAIQLIVDGADSEILKNIMETEIYAVEQRHRIGADIFEAAGGYAPTMGIIGTVMGLARVLSSIENPEKLAPAIAMAFMATLYGIVSANLLWLPIAAKLKYLSKREILVRELILDGVLSLQAGYNPILIRDRLTSFLNPRKRSMANSQQQYWNY